MELVLDILESGFSATSAPLEAPQRGFEHKPQPAYPGQPACWPRICAEAGDTGEITGAFTERPLEFAYLLGFTIGSNRPRRLMDIQDGVRFHVLSFCAPLPPALNHTGRMDCQALRSERAICAMSRSAGMDILGGLCTGTWLPDPAAKARCALPVLPLPSLDGVHLSTLLPPVIRRDVQYASQQ